MKNRKPELCVLLGLMLGAALMRLVPHPPNFTPIAAMALFGGAYFRSIGWALLIPLGAMLLSDTALELLFQRGFHGQMLWVYGSFALTIGIGSRLRHRKGVAPIAMASLSASTLFFIVTNLGVWMSGLLYAKNLSGLGACFAAAIPFFGRTLLGDLLYTGVLFGGYAWAGAKLWQRATIR